MAEAISKGRRALLKQGALCAVGVAGGLVAGRVPAQQGERVEESEPLAQQLMYVHDATQAPADVRGENEFCHNCQYFQSQEQTGFGPCVIFGNRSVSAEGWCNVWVARMAAGQG